MKPFQLLETAVHGEDLVLTLRSFHIKESQMPSLGEEFARVNDQGKYRKVILRLGPGRLECLYSVFLSKLAIFRRHLTKMGSHLVIADLHPDCFEIFQACHLDDYFHFASTLCEALESDLPLAESTLSVSVQEPNPCN